MIYFIVNNDFHIEHIQYYIKYMEQVKFTIIRIPYSLKNDCTQLSMNIFTFETPFRKSMGIIKKFITVHLLKIKIKQSFSFTKGDKVILLTEYDPLNQYIVYLAKKSNATTFLLQEGISTYYTNIKINNKKLNNIDKLKLFILRYIYGFKYLNWIKLSNNIFPQMDDRYIDNIFLYFNIKLDRKIKTTILTQPYLKLPTLDASIALFLNQPLYESYLTDSVYIRIINIEISILLKNYKKVIFKFHPRDHATIKKKLKTTFMDTHLIFMEDSIDLEETIHIHNPLNVYSFFSDALMRLELQGCKVHYLFHKYDSLKSNDLLKNIHSYLKNRIYPPISNKKYLLREIYEIK